MIRAVLTGEMTMDDNNNTIFTPWMEDAIQIITKCNIRSNTNLDIPGKILRHGNLAWVWEAGEILYMNENLLLEDTVEDDNDQIRILVDEQGREDVWISKYKHAKGRYKHMSKH